MTGDCYRGGKSANFNGFYVVFGLVVFICLVVFYYGGMLEKGLVQIYTGDGKGKTTAAFGLAVRSAGRGGKVLIYQFLKPSSLELGERMAIEKSGLGITIDCLDTQWDMFKSFDDSDTLAKTRAEISHELERIAESAKDKKYDCIILDELVFCVAKGLARIEDVKKLIAGRDRAVEIVMTGREATDELIELADLVTEMKKIKHPFDKGVCARKGIEY